jgi:hypothetical protein
VVEGILARYLGVFLPFLAFVVLGHLIVRSSGAWQLQTSALASPELFRRVLISSLAAIGIIVTVDLVTGGDLFLRPRSPQTEILIGLILVGLVAGRTALRAVAPLARRAGWRR